MSQQPNHPRDRHRAAQDAPQSDHIADLAANDVNADTAEQVKGGSEPVNTLRRPGTLRSEPIDT